VGRFLSLDPLSPKYPFYTPYQFAGNSPIENVDLDGGEDLPFSEKNEYGEKQVHLVSVEVLKPFRGGGVWVTEKHEVAPAGTAVTKNLSDKEIYRMVVLRKFFPGEFKIPDDQYLDSKFFEYKDNIDWYLSHNPNHNGSSHLQPETVKAIQTYYSYVLKGLFSNKNSDADEAVRLINDGASGWFNRLSWVKLGAAIIPWGAFAEFSTVTTGLSADARFAQSYFSEQFGNEGRFAGKTVDDVAGMLTKGEIQSTSVPVMYIVRDGKQLILNTRSAAALTKAGIPRANWTVLNMTGEEFFESLLSGQLKRNGLTNSGTATTTQGAKGTIVIGADKVTQK